MLQRPVVPFITSGLEEVKFTWNFAWAHSWPWTPGAAEMPACVWQALQSRPETFTSACVIWSWVPTGIPVVESALALVRTDESVRPAGRLFFVPATEPPPLVRPWHSLQLTGADTAGWKESALLHALPETFASDAWQRKQSFPATETEPWFIHWPWFVEVLPFASVYDQLLWVDAFAAGSEPAWQSMHTRGCEDRDGWYAPPCHELDAIGVFFALERAAV